MDGRMEGRKDGRMDVWKFTPVFYRTSALWGRCPKRRLVINEEEEKEEEEEEEEKNQLLLQCFSARRELPLLAI